MGTRRRIAWGVCLAVWSAACGGGGGAGGSDAGGDPPAACGNAIVELGEACDDGNATDEDTCLTTCISATCGDGVRQADVEACDDGAANSDTGASACRTNCTLARCGDGVTDTGEGCDDGNATDTDACLSTCVSATCGDGIVQASVEGCDDGGLNSDAVADACRTNCSVARCGDSVVDSGEACDDMNASNTDACVVGCAAASCGDGFVESGIEACDDGAANSDVTANACRTSCSAASCGDGVTDASEACDDANLADTDACLTSCAAASCTGPLRGDWDFEETSGLVLDASGCQLHGAGSAELVRGAAGLGLAASFAVAGANVTVPGVVASSFAGNWSLQAWVYRPANTGGPIVALADGNGIDGLVFSVDTTGKLMVQLGDSTCTQMLTRTGPSTLLAGNAWSHVAAEVYRDGSLMYMYWFIDGIFQQTSASGNLPICSDPNDVFTIGAVNTGATLHWPSRIDDVKLWTSARSSTQVCGDAGGVYTSSTNTCALSAVRPGS